MCAHVITRVGLVIVLVAAFACLGHVLGSASGTEAAEANSPKLHELYKARVELLEKMLDDVKTAYANSTASMEQVHQAHMALLKAQLDQAESPADRLQVLERILEIDKHREEVLIRLREKGAVREAQFDQTKVDRLSSEIAVERAKASK